MRSLELFSGMGGLAQGLELAGFEHVALVESNKIASQTLLANFHTKRVFNTKIQDFDLATLKDIDVVAGGPPCQPFSLGGQHQGNLDTRDLFPYAIRAIASTQPKAFIFENVKGLLRPHFADYFEYIRLRLTYPHFSISLQQNWQDHLIQLRKLKSELYSELQYKVYFKLINAADYGVPQSRERVFIVGIRSDLGLDWSFPEPTHSEDSLLWQLIVSQSYWQRHSTTPIVRQATRERFIRNQSQTPQLQPWRTIRDALRGVPDPRESHGIADHQFRDGARVYPGHTGSDFDWVAKTIKAGGHGVPGGENMIRFTDGTVRYFTVFEAKRIQAIPDEFIICGAWGEAMRQIGNAVPVSLAQTFGQELMKKLLSSTTYLSMSAKNQAAIQGSSV